MRLAALERDQPAQAADVGRREAEPAGVRTASSLESRSSVRSWLPMATIVRSISSGVRQQLDLDLGAGVQALGEARDASRCRRPAPAT